MDDGIESIDMDESSFMDDGIESIDIDANEPIIVDSYEEDSLSTESYDKGMAELSDNGILGVESTEKTINADSNTLSKSNEASLIVTPSAESYEYGSDARLNINLTGAESELLDGYVIVTVDSRQHFVNVTGGSSYLIISGLENNTYPVFAEFLGNDLYEPVRYDEATIVVNKSTLVTGNATVNDIIYGDIVTINITNLSDVDGKLISVFGGYQLVGPVHPYGSFSVKKGKATISLSTLPVGNYSAYIVFGNNVGGNYKFENFIVNFTVFKANPTLNANIEDITYGNDAGLAINLSGVNGEKLNETLMITLNGEDYGTVDSNNGIGGLTFPNLSVGNYTVGIYFSGLNSTNYNPAEYVLSFDVKKATNATVDIHADSIKEGEDALIKVNVKDGQSPLNGWVIINFNGRDFAVNVSDGEGSLLIANLAANEYPINARFLDNDCYGESQSEEIILIVNKFSSVIGEIFSEGENIIVCLNDSEGNPIYAKINLTVDGETTEEELADGKLSIPSSYGLHSVSVKYLGDDGHAPLDLSKEIYIDFELDTELSLALEDIEYGEDAKATVILVDERGNRLNATVNITVGNQTKELTLSNGEGTIEFNGLNAGTYLAVADFIGADGLKASYDMKDFIVEKLTSQIVYENMTTTAVDVGTDGRVGEYFYITLTDSKGNALANRFIQIGFNGNVYNRTTDSDGKARLQINLKNAGTYTFAVAFLGDENYNGSFIVAKIVVGKQKGSLTVPSKSYKVNAKTKTLTATFKTNAGNPIVGKTVKFTVNGKTYSAKTDSNGIAKVNVSLNKKGIYSVSVSTVATGTYESVSTKSSLKIS